MAFSNAVQLPYFSFLQLDWSQQRDHLRDNCVSVPKKRKLFKKT